MRLGLSLAISALVACLSTTAFAKHHGYGPQGFESGDVSTVAGVLNNAYDDQIVTLNGRLVSYYGRDRYEFADQSGSIEVELDDDYNWSHIAKDELIQITGKVDRDFLSTTIEVKRAVSLEKQQPVATTLPANIPAQVATPKAAPAATTTVPATTAPAAPTEPAAK